MADLISSSVYDTLKHQVQQLKLEQQSIAGQRAKHKEVCGCQIARTGSATTPFFVSAPSPLPQIETAAVLQQKLHYEEQLHSARQEASSLQQRLKESVERASKVRQHAERCAASLVAGACPAPLLQLASP